MVLKVFGNDFLKDTDYLSYARESKWNPGLFFKMERFGFWNIREEPKSWMNLMRIYLDILGLADFLQWGDLLSELYI